MSDHDEQIADRIAALESKLDAKAAEAVALERALHTPPKHGGAGFSKEALYRQEKALHERRILREEWQREYDQQLRRAKPKTDQLEAKLRELGTRRQEIERRYAAELAKVRAEGDRVRREVGKLSTPPPLPPDPPTDAEEVTVGYDMGHVQVVPKAAIDAQKRRHRQVRTR
jgi:hypothetical protein